MSDDEFVLGEGNRPVPKSDQNPALTYCARCERRKYADLDCDLCLKCNREERGAEE